MKNKTHSNKTAASSSSSPFSSYPNLLLHEQSTLEFNYTNRNDRILQIICFALF